MLIALPALGAAILLLGGKRTNKFGPALATGLSWASFAVGAVIFVTMLGLGAEERAAHAELWNWIPAGQFQLSAGLLVDQLSMSFVLLITFVGSLIHVYSLGYMEHDPDKRRFFAYLNLFVASMLVLVLADSTSSSSSVGRVSVWRPTCSSASGTTTRRMRPRPTRPSSSTGR